LVAWLRDLGVNVASAEVAILGGREHGWTDELIKANVLTFELFVRQRKSGHHITHLMKVFRCAQDRSQATGEPLPEGTVGGPHTQLLSQVTALALPWVIRRGDGPPATRSMEGRTLDTDTLMRLMGCGWSLVADPHEVAETEEEAATVPPMVEAHRPGEATLLQVLEAGAARVDEEWRSEPNPLKRTACRSAEGLSVPSAPVSAEVYNPTREAGYAGNKQLYTRKRPTVDDPAVAWERLPDHVIAAKWKSGTVDMYYNQEMYVAERAGGWADNDVVRPYKRTAYRTAESVNMAAAWRPGLEAARAVQQLAEAPAAGHANQI
jgi:hypothetical protein